MYSKISGRIRQIRDKKTQVDFAEDLGVSQEYISALEHGRSEPNYFFLTQLIKKYHVSIDWLMGNSEARILEIKYKKSTIETNNPKLIMFIGSYNLAEQRDYTFITEMPEAAKWYLIGKQNAGEIEKDDLMDILISGE